jgi:hypothetical protein
MSVVDQNNSTCSSVVPDHKWMYFGLSSAVGAIGIPIT